MAEEQIEVQLVVRSSVLEYAQSVVWVVERSIGDIV